MLVLPLPEDVLQTTVDLMQRTIELVDLIYSARNRFQERFKGNEKGGTSSSNKNKQPALNDRAC
jgi:hypothetical protein